MARLIFTEGFVEDVADKVELATKRAQIQAACRLLADFPEMGLPSPRTTLKEAFGEGIRTIPVSPFTVVYEYSAPLETVYVLGLMHGRQVR